MRTLYSHQQRALDKLPATGGYLGFEQGLGKTLTAIAYANRWDYYKVLVVAPAIALGVWERELEEEGHSVLMPQGTRKNKASTIRSYEGDGYTVINYEALLEPEVERAISRGGYDLLIVDEAHKIKTATAKRSKVLHRLGKQFPALLLSGTPITKNLLDLYSQYKVIEPDIWNGSSWTSFKQFWGIWGGYGGYELIGYRDPEGLKDRIAPYTVVARKEDTLDLPSKTHTIVPVDLGKSSSSYREMALTGVSGEWVTSNPLEKALRLAQITSAAKIEATVAWAEDMMEMDEPVVIYVRFLNSLFEIGERLGVMPLHGGTTQAMRTEMVRNFQGGANPVFLAQIAAGSVGITLTRASHMWYNDLSFAYEDWAQSQDRIHRIGQEYPVNYYYATAVGPRGGRTIDHLVYDAVQRKDDVAGYITRNPELLLETP
jgi:SNF2 family DNA or RNA helicase